MTTHLDARRVLRPDGSLRPGRVVFDEAEIVAVDELDGAMPDRLVAPGLVDIQVNGFGPFDVSGSADELQACGTLLARHGTTSWCPTLTSRPLAWYQQWLDSHPDPAPGEIGLHLEGPFITHAGAHRRQAMVAPDPDWLERLPPRVAYVTLAPELPGGIDAIAALARRTITVALGHSDATYEQAGHAADAGARLVTHVFNAMVALAHRHPGLAGAALSDDRLVPAVIGDGVHVHPAVLKVVLGVGPAILVSDAVAWERPGLDATSGAARLPDGTLAGSVICVLDAVRTAVGAGVPLATALMAATATPAQGLGHHDIGVLRPGARADMVVLGPRLDLEEVWVAGRPLDQLAGRAVGGAHPY